MSCGLVLLCGTLIARGAGAQESSALKHSTDDYRLVWSADFRHEGQLDSKDWVFEKGFVRNGEAQWYQPENATCSDGKLTIQAKREMSKKNPLYDPAASSWPLNQKLLPYTSACVKTIGKHAWLYGRFEIRAKIDTRPGSWPAFWMMGTQRGWPACGEVDIMEYYRGTLLANIAWAQQGGANHSMWNTGKKPISLFPADWPSQFHTWRMDWDENFIKLYCDDQLMNTQDLAKTIDPDGFNPFHSPMYILLNQAIGGTCGGDPANTLFPVNFQIDYVRVYQTPAQVASSHSG